MNEVSDHWRRFCADLGERNFLPIYQATERLVWTICWRLLHDEADARDAFQSAYTRLLNAARTQSADDPVALARRFAALEAQSLAKRRARLARREAEPVDDHLQQISEGAPASDVVARQQLRALLESAAGNLEDDLRTPVELHFFDGMTQREVAEVLGVSVSTVNDRLKRALERLRPVLRRAGIQRPEDALPMLLPLAMLLTPPADVSAAAVFTQACKASAGPTAGWQDAEIGKSTLGRIAAAAVFGALVAVICTVFFRGRSEPAAKPTASIVMASAIVPMPKARATAETLPSAAEASRPTPVPTAAPAPTPAATAASTRRGGLSIGGVVVDELAGSPVPAVAVRLGILPTDAPITSDFENQRLVASTTTSASGEFDFPGLAPAAYALFVDSDHYRLLDEDLSMFERVDLAPGLSQPDVRLEAFAGNQLSGVVRNADTGAPLEGARVASTNRMLQIARQRLGIARPPLEEAVAVTGADGKYVLPAVFGERYTGGSNGGAMTGFRAVNLSYGKEGYTARHDRHLPGTDPMFSPIVLTKSVHEQTHDLSLVAEVQCHLAITDAGGAPIAGASIKMVKPYASYIDFAAWPWKSDAEGHALVNIPKGTNVSLDAQAPGFIRGGTELKLDSENAGKPWVLQLQSLGGNHLVFRLQDEKRRAVTDHKRVFLEGMLQGGGRYISESPLTFEPDGIVKAESFNPAEVAKGELFLSAKHDSRYLPLEYRIKPEDMLAAQPVPIVLHPRGGGRKISGTITNGSAGPVVGASVSAPGDSAAARTDTEGRYEISASPEVTLLVVRHPELGVTAVRELHDGENDLDWSKANAIAEVRIFDASTHKPMNGMEIKTDENWSQHSVRDQAHPHAFFVEQGIQPGHIKLQIGGARLVFQEMDLAIPPGTALFAAPIEINAPGPPVPALWASFEPGT